MPVRIYDISKKLGLESKEVLAKARALNITTARVASSTIDKITAEYLEAELLKDHPEIALPPQAPPAPPPEPQQPLKVIKAPEETPVAEPPPSALTPSAPPSTAEAVAAAPTPTETTVAAPAPAGAPPATPPQAVAAAPLAEARVDSVTVPTGPAPVTSSTAAQLAPAAPPAPPAAPPPPPEPPKPRIGEKVGFIKLPPRPGQKPSAAGPTRAQPKPEPAKGRTIQPASTVTATAARTAPGVAAPRPAEAPKPAPRIVLPPDAPSIVIKPPIVVRDLATQLGQKPFKIIGDLMEMGVFANVNQTIEEDIARRICAKYGFRFEVERRERGAGLVRPPVKKVEVDLEDKPEDLKPRPPVVTIMGHVDHGKTTLLDVIRKSDVAAHEAGGITQHIGAYTISFPHPERKNELQQITFLDTPGHAAFSAMRARGANVTDIVVLVVAANDGVMPQTVEALNHARAAKVPIIVAINKCDHPNANPLRVRQQLQELGLVPDDWGGDTIFVECSALTKKGVDKLLEMILLQADLLELKANPNRPAKGNVIESGIEPGGPTATVLVRKGTLRVGDMLLCGEYYGKARALINAEGQRLKEATPSMAVKVLGLNGVPEAGVEFTVVENERIAREEAEKRREAARARSQESRAKITLENLFATLASQQQKVLRVVVKADTQGSVEAIVDALKKIESDKVSLEIIHSGVGAVSENDVVLASASHGIILGFHTRVDSTAAERAKQEGVQIKLYTIIYELIDEVKLAMAGLLEPEIREVVIGTAEVRQVFHLSKGVPVAGSMVTSGRIVRGKVRVRRRKEIVYEGVVQSLRRFQDEVSEVRAGLECGIRIEGFSDVQVGDVIECYTVEKVAPKL
jgi:translation initiation factor IF-2